MGYTLFLDPRYLNKPPRIRQRLDPNIDLSFTLDVAHLADPTQALRTCWGYGAVDVLLTERFTQAHWPPETRFLEFEEADMRNTGLGQFARPEPGPQPYFRVTERSADGSSSTEAGLRQTSYLQMEANHLGVPLDVLVLAMAHCELSRNYLVSDDPDMLRLRGWMGRDRKQHIIPSDELIATLRRLQRRRGVYYTSAHNTCNRGLYYWRELLRRVPEYDLLWATAIYGCQDPASGLPSELFDFAQSLSHRIIRLMELRDEIEPLTEDSPHNDLEWDIVAKLNDFFVLVTGVLDNLAWLAVARQGQLGHYLQSGRRNRVSLHMPRPAGVVTPSPFHRELEQWNRQFYDHVFAHQGLMAVFYPIRDSVQHRWVLSGCQAEILDRDWVAILVRFAPEALAALRALEPAVPYNVNSWGLFEFAELTLVEPNAFTRVALDRMLDFTRTALDILDMPALLEGQPALKAQVMQGSPLVAALLAR